nr:sphingoid long-chain bases kinase 1-like [Ipomoea batatas]
MIGAAFSIPNKSSVQYYLCLIKFLIFSLSCVVGFKLTGIICVGGDGIVNEVLNGLLCRTDQKEAISIPIGIILAGTDNSLVWTVLSVRDPISAAIAIVKEQVASQRDMFDRKWRARR